MHIGDKLLLHLVSKNGSDYTRIIHTCCEFLDPEVDINAIKRVLGYCFNKPKNNRPKGCIEFEYKGECYWRDAWDIIYSQETKGKIGKYYPQSNWVSIGYH